MRSLNSIPSNGVVNVRLEALSYIDHACFSVLQEWGQRRDTNGGVVQLEWEELEQRNRGLVVPEVKKAS